MAPKLRPRPLNRPTPRVGVGNMLTFQIAAPLGRWWRRATCAEVECRDWVNGWESTIDERSEQGHAQGLYIRRQSGRSFRVGRDGQGMTVFTFVPGQRCFHSGDHYVRDFDIPEVFVARAGDWRGNPTGYTVRHSGPDPWFDHLATTVSAVSERAKKG